MNGRFRGCEEVGRWIRESFGRNRLDLSFVLVGLGLE
jgi:hypothetical protein